MDTLRNLSMLEILVVVAIVGILASVALASLSKTGGNCSQYSERPLKEVPAKCAYYFNL